jgi:hypothetical protein
MAGVRPDRRNSIAQPAGCVPDNRHYLAGASNRSFSSWSLWLLRFPMPSWIDPAHPPYRFMSLPMIVSISYWVVHIVIPAAAATMGVFVLLQSSVLHMNRGASRGSAGPIRKPVQTMPPSSTGLASSSRLRIRISSTLLSPQKSLCWLAAFLCSYCGGHEIKFIAV